MTRPARRRGGGREGFALVLALWFLVVFLLAVLAMGHFLRLETRADAFRQGRLGAYYAARAGFGQAATLLCGLWADGRPGAFVHRGWQSWSQGRYQGRFLVWSEGGKFNLNNAGQGSVARALQRLGLERGRAQALRDAIFDWVDGDNTPRLSGAEARFYGQVMGAPGPRNGPFDCLGELAGVAGVEPEMLLGLGPRARELGLAPGRGLWSVFTVYGDHRAVNLNGAPPEVLHCLPCMPARAVERLLKARAREPLHDVDQARRVLGEEVYNLVRPWVTLDPSPYYTVISQGWRKGSATRRSLLAVVRLDEMARIDICYWIDDLYYALPDDGDGSGGL